MARFLLYLGCQLQPNSWKRKATPIEPSRNRPSRSIRYKVLGLVFLSAILPTALVGTSSYWTARSTLTEKVSDQLNSHASLAAARIAEWYQERRHDARVFGGSTMVVGRLSGSGVDSARTRAYLDEVKGRYGAYRALAVLDLEGRLVASAGSPPAEELAMIAAKPVGAGSALTWGSEGPSLWVSSPILGDDGRMLGRFVLACDFESLREILAEEHAMERLRLSAGSGGVLLTHPAGAHESEDFPEALPADGGITELRNGRGDSVLAAARAVRVVDLEEPLLLTVTTDSRVAFASVTQLRHRIVLLSAVIVVFVLALAYGVVANLSDPLERLAIRAQAVAHGDYASDLPVRSRDEIGYLTEVFNRMTSNLKASHERLERLSTTDELTQLVNRRELRRVLEREVAHSQRTDRPLAVVMIDIDHFKAFNDAFGHLRGDELLGRVGGYLRDCLDDHAIAARYGGEEFLLLMPGATLDRATEMAERVRQGFQEHVRPDEVTLSLGVAAWGRDGKTPAKLMEAADTALYEAKRRGRNQVVVAEESPPEGKAKTPAKGKAKGKTGRPRRTKSTPATVAT